MKLKERPPSEPKKKEDVRDKKMKTSDGWR